MQEWWITLGERHQLPREKVLGPFTDQKLALSVRAYIAKIDDVIPERYFVEGHK